MIMIKAGFITVHPGLIEEYKKFGVFRSALEQNLVSIESINLRDFAVNKSGMIDDRPYGGGDGMVMRPEPLKDAIDFFNDSCDSRNKATVIYTSPQGKPFTQADAERLSESGNNIIFICGRFGGIDQRIIDHYVDEEYSMGDFVISGGELPSIMIMDSVLRTVPGVLGHHESCANDSFGSGCEGYLEPSQYTRPDVFMGHKVPEVLMSGDHEKIKMWKKENSRTKTAQKRPDLI